MGEASSLPCPVLWPFLHQGKMGPRQCQARPGVLQERRWLRTVCSSTEFQPAFLGQINLSETCFSGTQQSPFWRQTIVWYPLIRQCLQTPRGKPCSNLLFKNGVKPKRRGGGCLQMPLVCSGRWATPWREGDDSKNYMLAYNTNACWFWRFLLVIKVGVIVWGKKIPLLSV